MTLSKSFNPVSWRAPLFALPAAAALAGLALLYAAAPPYLFRQGFPLDDAWIHAVYAREFARTGMLAYNPGVPSTGDTAPLWPLLLSLVYRFAPSVPWAVAGTKVVGFLLHVGACSALGASLAVVLPHRRAVAYAAAALAGLHPNLIAASVSGMEVPLAEAALAGLLHASLRANGRQLALASALAFGARPELAVIGGVLPLLLWRSERRLSLKLSLASAAGTAAGLAVLGIRNHLISGRLLPATFYVKANRDSPFSLLSQHVGFVDLLGRVPLFQSGIIVVAFLLLSVFLLGRRRDRSTETAGELAAASLFISGIVFCAVSFGLVLPLDPAAFYHERYVLPGVFLLVLAIPLLIDAVVNVTAPGYARLIDVVAVAFCALTLLIATPARARRLSSDTRNIDDVQVALGRALGSAPQDAVAWVVDAGASRFFGRAFVVDTIGLNTPELLDAHAQAYLDAHRPAFLDVFPGWSQVALDTAAHMPIQRFEASTRYTVTSVDTMREHILVRCEPPSVTGSFVVRGRVFRFQCSS